MLLVRTWKEVKQAGSHKDAPTKTVCQANSSFQPPFVQSVGVVVVGLLRRGLLRRGLVLVDVVRPYHQLKGQGSNKIVNLSLFFYEFQATICLTLIGMRPKHIVATNIPTRMIAFSVAKLISSTKLILTAFQTQLVGQFPLFYNRFLA